MALSIAIYGYDTDIGKLILEVMEERSFALRELFPLSPFSGEYDAVTLSGRNFMVSGADEFDFTKADVAFFITTKDESLRLVDKARAAGCIVIDNSRLYAGSVDIPAILPELNPFEIKNVLGKKTVIPVSSAATELALPLSALHDEFGLCGFNATVLESVSEHGRSGTETLARESAHLLNGLPPESSDFPAQLAFNLHDRIGDQLEDGFTGHERVVMQELNHLLGVLPKSMSLTCLQVPVFYGHTAIVHAELEEDASLEEIRNCFAAKDYLSVGDPAELLSPVTHGVRDTKIYLSRLRKTPASRRLIDFVCVMDNTRRGEALNCVQIAELLYRELHS